jgi:hypothetical protein
LIGRPRPLLVNGHEINTDKALERAAEAAGYKIAPKVRVADVLSIAGSGLSNAEYSYALRSHFDWVVTEGDERTPQFAVEFDGSSHEIPAVAARDALKDRIVTHFGFPLLRIDGTFLRRVRKRPLLEILVEAWKAWRAFMEAQEAGEIAWDEPWMYQALFDVDPDTGAWMAALAIDAPGRGLVRRLHERGVCRSFMPTSLVQMQWGRPVVASYAMVELTDGTFVTGQSRIRSYNFEPIPAWELAGDLAIENLRMNLRLWMEGHDVAVTADDVARIRVEHPEAEGWLAEGITHPLWMTA